MTSLAQYPGPVEAVAAVRELNFQYLEAVRANDVEWFRVQLGEDAVVIQGNGRRLRKAGFLAILKNEPRDYLALRVRDATFRVFGPIVQAGR